MVAWKFAVANDGFRLGQILLTDQIPSFDWLWQTLSGVIAESQVPRERSSGAVNHPPEVRIEASRATVSLSMPISTLGE
jgi:hypothetical protein